MWRGGAGMRLGGGWGSWMDRQTGPNQLPLLGGGSRGVSGLGGLE